MGYIVLAMRQTGGLYRMYRASSCDRLKNPKNPDKDKWKRMDGQ